jgi:putative glutamine amidotransferase
VSERPLIGVTTSELRLAERVEQTPEGDPPRTEMALGMPYLRAIEAAGGLPVVMPPLELEAVEPLLARLDGVCLSGGPDLDPSGYRAQPHPKLGPTEPSLDRFELAVARAADAQGLPVLAICRGAQALNVARGGTLYQHLPDRPRSKSKHRQTEPGDQVTHSIKVGTGSRLARLLGRRSCRVNSFHHQAVKKLGRGLTAVAWAPDGVVEAIEGAGPRFLVGVQWHAELLVERRGQAALFEGLVAAALAHGVPGTVAEAA